MYTLFDEIDPEFSEKIRKKKAKQALFIPKTAKKENLSAEQKKFNRQVKDIEKLTKKIEELKLYADSMLNEYVNEIKPKRVELSNNQIEFVKLIDPVLERYNFSKLALRKAEFLMSFTFDLYKTYSKDVDEDFEKILKKWGFDFNEHIDEDFDFDLDFNPKNQHSDLFDMLSNLILMQTGTKISADELAALKEQCKSEKEFEQELLKRIDKETMQKENTFEDFGNYQPKKKKANKPSTKKQLQLEEKRKQEEENAKKLAEMKQRSVKSIYLSLVKALHPDTETNEQLKQEKDELMRVVTKAYKQNDLKKLFEIELAFLKNEKEHLERLTEENLVLYNEVLKDQIAELKNEYNQVLMNPRYEEISMMLNYVARYRRKDELKKMKQDLERTIGKVKQLIGAVSGNPSKKIVTEAISEYVSIISNDIKWEYGFDDLCEYPDFCWK